MRRARLFAFGFDDFLTPIITAGADMVAQMHLACRRLDCEGRAGEEVVRPVHAALRG